MHSSLDLHEFSWIDEDEKTFRIDDIDIEKILSNNASPYAKAFDISMGKFGHIYFQNQFLTKRNSNRYLYFRNLFVQNNPEVIEPSTVEKVPKILHFIWIGEKPIPAYFKGFEASWRKHHPDWNVMLWTDKEVARENFATMDLWPYCCNIAQKADILRYEILLRWGGVYVDTDFECLASFNNLVYQYDFFAGLLPEYPPRIGVFKRKVVTPTLQVMNALIGSRAGHPILEKTIQNIRERLPIIATSKRYDGLNYIWQGESIKVVLSTMMSFRDAVIACAYPSQYCNVVFPSTYFYPILPSHALSDGKNVSTDFRALKDESMANHFYAASWSDKKGKLVRNMLTKLKNLKIGTH